LFISPAQNRAQVASDTRDAIIEGDASSVSSDEVASPKIVLKNTKRDLETLETLLFLNIPPLPKICTEIQENPHRDHQWKTRMLIRSRGILNKIGMTNVRKWKKFTLYRLEEWI
jgi:hypothetical protein